MPHKRHTCATNLLKNGADILGVQGILGHASAATTLRYYGHVTGNEHLRTAMDHYEAPQARWALPRDIEPNTAPSRGRVQALGADSGPRPPAQQHPETGEEEAEIQQ
ncbi:MAG: tyrosine-type recombinase/integrase [Candidatus Nanopelagicales bacterium]